VSNCSKADNLFNHLIGKREQLRRYVEAQRLCRPEIEHQLEFDCLLNCQVVANHNQS
jgi:hypothetical protein